MLPAAQIHAAQQEACFGIWRGDPRAACIVGPATYYNRFRLGPEWLIPAGGPVIYAANFFEPRLWVQGRNFSFAYGGDFPCCDVYQKDKDAERRRQVCGVSEGTKGCDSAPMVRVDRSWLADELRPILDFRARHGVPVWVDQFGVRQTNAGGDAAQQAYITGLLSLLQRERLHWTYWIWRRVYAPRWGCYGYAVQCQEADGTYHVNRLVQAALATYLGQSTTDESSTRRLK